MKKEPAPTWVKEGGLTELDMWRSRNDYPAGVMDSDTCEHNGLRGNCGFECKCYQLGNCPIEDEVAEAEDAVLATQEGRDGK